MTLLQYALHLAGQGFPVFPLSGKLPLPGSAGFKDASLDATAIRAMPWHPANAVGIATGGAGRLIVFDIDTDKTGATPLATSTAIRRLGVLPLTTTTRIVRTPSGGVHFYCRVAQDALDPTLPLPTSRANVLGTKAKDRGGDGVALDVRCAGGYVVGYTPAAQHDYALGELPLMSMATLQTVGILPDARKTPPAKGAAGNQIMRNSLAQWRDVAFGAVRLGGIPLTSNDPFQTFACALASAVRDEGHQIDAVLAIFHEICAAFPNYDAAREEARFLSFLRADYSGARPGFGTLAHYAEQSRLVALAATPVTAATGPEVMR